MRGQILNRQPQRRINDLNFSLASRDGARFSPILARSKLRHRVRELDREIVRNSGSGGSQTKCAKLLGPISNQRRLCT
jgi:hypothetical protein